MACVLHTQADGAVSAQVRTVSTMTADLAALSGWLRAQGVECVALESTGVFWWPVFNLLEEQGHRVVLVNAAHMKAIPGHKTDIADSKWLADLLRHGLLRPSFIPPAPIRALRELVRQRTTLVQQRAQETNRLQKVLEGWRRSRRVRSRRRCSRSWPRGACGPSCRRCSTTSPPWRRRSRPWTRRWRWPWPPSSRR